MAVTPQTTRIIAVANPQAGVGKTTIAINLAASLFKLGHPCLLVDLDHDAQATHALGVNLRACTHSAYTVMRGLSRFAESYLPTLAGIDLLPGNLELALLETPVFAANSSLRQLLDSHEVIQHYHFIVLDCPSALSPRVQDAVAAADEVLVPFRIANDQVPSCAVLTTLAQGLAGRSIRPVANMVRGNAVTRLASKTVFGTAATGDWVQIHYSPKLLTRSRHGLPAVVRWPGDVFAQDFAALVGQLRAATTALPI
jgi:cellulose biosynthesis protein BcsQ